MDRTFPLSLLPFKVKQSIDPVDFLVVNIKSFPFQSSMYSPVSIERKLIRYLPYPFNQKMVFMLFLLQHLIKAAFGTSKSSFNLFILTPGLFMNLITVFITIQKFFRITSFKALTSRSLSANSFFNLLFSSSNCFILLASGMVKP